MGAADDESMIAILETAQIIQQRLESTLEEVGLSSAKFQALSALAEAGEPLPLSELATRLRCVRSNITQLVDRLEAEALVQRVSDPSDRRSVRAELTELGRDRQAAGSQRVVGLKADLDARVSPLERALFQRILAALE